MRGQIGIIVHGLPVTWEGTDVVIMLASWPFHEAIKQIQFYHDADLFDVVVFAPRDLRVVNPGPGSLLNLWVEIQPAMGGVRTEVLQQMADVTLGELKKWLDSLADILSSIDSITVVIPSREVYAMWRADGHRT